MVGALGIGYFFTDSLPFTRFEGGVEFSTGQI